LGHIAERQRQRSDDYRTNYQKPIKLYKTNILLQSIPIGASVNPCNTLCTYSCLSLSLISRLKFSLKELFLGKFGTFPPDSCREMDLGPKESTNLWIMFFQTVCVNTIVQFYESVCSKGVTIL